MSKKMPRLRFFAEPSPNLLKYLNKKGFRFTDVGLHRMPNGWYCVVANWTAKKDSYLFKYCQKSSHTLGCGEISLNIEFTNIKRYIGDIDIGLQFHTDKKDVNDYLTPMFMQNLGYGVMVYFAPKDWESKMVEVERIDIDENGVLSHYLNGKFDAKHDPKNPEKSS